MAMYDAYGRATTVGQSCGFILDEGDSVGQIINVVGTWDADGSGAGAGVEGVMGLRITDVTGNDAASGSTDGFTTINADVI